MTRDKNVLIQLQVAIPKNYIGYRVRQYKYNSLKSFVAVLSATAWKYNVKFLQI